VKEGNAPNPTTATEVSQTESALPSDETESAPLSDEKTETLLETAECITEEDGNISCKLPNGQRFYVDGVTGQTFSGRREEKAPPASVINPKFKVLRVNSKGELNFEFSEPVNLEDLVSQK